MTHGYDLPAAMLRRQSGGETMTEHTPGIVRYDAALLPEPSGASDEWWQDAMRVELDRAHDFYADQFDPATAAERDELKADKADLVEALEMMVDEAKDIMVTNKSYGDPTGPDWEEWFCLKNARAAIAKAKETRR